MLMRMSIFSKIAVIICLLLVPIVYLYSYFYEASTDVVEEEVIKNNATRLSFFIHQVDTTADQLWKAAFNLSKDPDALKLSYRSILETSHDNIRSKEVIMAKTGIQSNTFSWRNELTIFAPPTGQVISTNPAVTYSADAFQSMRTKEWDYRRMATGFGEDYYFVRYLTEPFMATPDLDKANLVVEAAFAASNITEMLERLKVGNNDSPLFYRPGHEPIMGDGFDRSIAQEAAWQLQATELGAAGHKRIELAGQKHLMIYEKSASLGWYLVDFIPLEAMLEPMTNNRQIFYLSTGLLLLLSFLAAALLYRHVQVPIRELIRGVKRLKRGDYSGRVSSKTNNEFSFLFAEFNHMTEEIRVLIEHVYAEKLRVREATLKQLQSQINPHFLYNSFAFIQSMAQLDNKKAIIAVTHHLSKYYRYTTRLEKPNGTMAEEIELVRNYLEIQRMQMHRLQFEIELPDELLPLSVPRLILQPIVENAVIHGIQPKPGDGRIRIAGEATQEAYIVYVEDNGAGMDEESLAKLEKKLLIPPDDDSGCGLWNIRQRLIRQFGPGSDLELTRLPSGGMRAAIRIARGEDNVVSTAHRG